uniref:Uncharacterized protein n=1 Tax=Oryza sativa subsp. japonica TaxID=39947 RepID=Q5Z5F3_ORYSJ|nr:hypothetical protein [Oryza sativa Japonica Group]
MQSNFFWQDIRSSRASRLRHQEAIQSFVKEKSFVISEKGALGIVKSLVSLTGKPKHGIQLQA